MTDRLSLTASANVVPRERIAALQSHDVNAGASLSFFADQILDLPFGYRVRFTIEEQPTATCRHLSIAVDESGMMPNPEAVRALMQEFGFVNELRGCASYIEEFDPGHRAINLVEPLSGRMDEMRRRWPPGRD